MNIFNSLGSNYDFSFVLKSLSAFERYDLENFLESKYGGKAILLYKGREAIELALKLSKIPKASFVAINGFTCFAVYEAVKNAGLNLEYLDIDKGELNFSAEALEEAVEKNPKIKAVIIQNTLGYPCKMMEISKICKDKKLILIEDLAHSVGIKYSDGTEAGLIGDFVVLSFSQDKMIDGISGGALISRLPVLSVHLEGVATKQQIIDRFYPLFTFLIRKTYPIYLGKILHEILKRLNFLSKPVESLDSSLHNLPNWYCSLINTSFEALEENLNHRRQIANIYNENINPKVISKILADQINLSSNLRFQIFVNDRSKLIKYLSQHGLYVSDIWYDAPIAPKKYLDQTDYKGQCPNAELAASAILNLPTHINVSEKDAEKISNFINQWLTL